ncbi:hypothetical protein TNCV_3258031 [Trichonephila clavipes]|nr:hypothetical protein TNCV_3258031 [Trichonephila clavipes]
MVALLVGGGRCLATVQYDTSQYGKAPLTTLLTSTIREFLYDKIEDIHYMYDRANDNSTAALRMHLAQFPDRRMPDQIIFQQLHRKRRETRSYHVNRFKRNICLLCCEFRFL